MAVTFVHERGPAAVKPAQLGEVLAVGAHLLVGQYRVELATGVWWWSDEIYVMHGWVPGEIEPSLDALRSRKHPDDRNRVVRVATDALRAGRPFSCGHRIIDGAGKARTVIVTGQGRRDGNKVAQIAGYVVDVTPVRQEILDRESTRAVTRAFVSAAVIEQSKGVLMATRGIDEGSAARVISEHAGRVGITVREAASQMMAGLGNTGGFDGDANGLVAHALDSLHEVARPRSHNAQLARRRDRSTD